MPSERAGSAILAATLFLAAIACARADVTPPVPIGSGGLPEAATSTTSSPQLSTPLPSATALPPTTSTPSVVVPPASPTFPATPTLGDINTSETILYHAQSGDTLFAVAVRFGLVPSDVSSPDPLPEPSHLIDPDQVLLIPRRLGATGPSERLMPDSEIVFAPHAADFDVAAFAAAQGGYLNRYQEYVGGRLRLGPEVVAIVARDNSVNPRLLLALLEYQSGWLSDPTRPTGNDLRYPMGKVDTASQGLFRQLTWLANELGLGYYGWRAGTLTDLTFDDGTAVRLAPTLNAGTVALHYYFSVQRSPIEWADALGPEGFIATYMHLFGDPWAMDYPIFIPGVVQPPLTLPFLPGHVWSFTGGPHGAWEREAAWAALDFAPGSSEPGCAVSEDWAVAAAPGLVLRSEDGVVVLDLDGDGREQTGWVLIYLHIAASGRVRAGEFVEEGDRIGHPSCVGGVATGTHIHFVRKYNGEWILADGPLPFELSGWVAHAGSLPYEGWLTNGDRTVVACPCASQETRISR